MEEQAEIFAEMMDDVFESAYSSALVRRRQEILGIKKNMTEPHDCCRSKSKTQGRMRIEAHFNANCRVKRLYEEMEQSFATHQFATSETDSTSISQRKRCQTHSRLQ